MKSITIAIRALNSDLVIKSLSLLNNIKGERRVIFNTETSGHYLCDVLFNTNTDWLINIDEDAFVYDIDKIFSLIDYMDKNDYHICGVPDGGVVHCRKHNPVAMNPFFNIIDLRKIRKIPRCKPGKENDKSSFTDDLKKYTPHNLMKIKYVYDNFQWQYYPIFFHLLRNNVNFLYLDAYEFTDNFSSVVKDHEGNDFLIHTWYARSYDNVFYKKFDEYLDYYIEKYGPPVIDNYKSLNLFPRHLSYDGKLNDCFEYWIKKYKEENIVIGSDLNRTPDVKDINTFCVHVWFNSCQIEHSEHLKHKLRIDQVYNFVATKNKTNIGIVVPAFNINFNILQRFIDGVRYSNPNCSYKIYISSNSEIALINDLFNKSKILNYGIQQLFDNCEVIVCTDVDIIPAPGMIDLTFQKAMQTKGNVFSFVRNIAPVNNWDQYLKNIIEYKKLSMQYSGKGGWNAMIPDMWYYSGGWNEDLVGWGYEDIEFHERLIKKNINIFTIMNKLLFHMNHPIRNSNHINTQRNNVDVAKSKDYLNYNWLEQYGGKSN